MKKSKFLKSSKDMLHRSFNPSKCKTSLRLAGSRLKLLRNKKEVQVKQMKREIAQLLDSGQNQTARIRVEHVIREEKMMTAYDLIELYCELIVARLPIIETQKICPIDLKEAITSVVFASPRCGDVPELIDIRKQFTEKYGKEFITAAVELRPGCGVSRLLVEKLSAVAPDGQTKIKTLSTIAEEHNVEWDPKSFSESSLPASDLLHGPSSFGEESKLHAEPSHFEGPVPQVPQSNNRVHDSQSNLTQVDNRTSPGAERLASTKISGVNQSFQHKARPPALDDERAQFFQGDRNTLSRDRQRWNMEFKDATSAAQVAAESAELASMAARAAAELSNRDRIVRQYSNESHYSDANVSNDGGREAYVNSRFSSEHSFEESKNRSFPEHTKSQNELINRMQPNNRKTDGSFKDTSPDGRRESTQSASLRSIKDKSLDGRKEFTQSASIDNNSLDHHAPVVDGYSQQNSLKDVSRGGTSKQRESFKHYDESVSGWPEKSENVREERVGKQPSARSSNSHSSISNDVNIFANSKDQKYEYGAGEVPDFGKKDIYEEASPPVSHESADVVFDKSESDSENQGFDMSPTYDEPKQRIHMPFSGQKPLEHLSTNTDSWSPRSSTSETAKSSSSLFLTRKSSSTDSSERSIDGSKHDDSGPVVFDQSDVPTSESDEDMNLFRHPRISRDHLSTQNQSIGSTSESEEETNVSRDFLSTQNQSVGSQFKDKNELSVGSSLKGGSPRFILQQSSLSKTEETGRESNQEKKLGAANSTPEIEGGLNFEKLTGGFRHKGYNHPPYLKNRFDVSSSSNNESEENTTTIPKSITPPAVESPRMIEHKKSRTPYLQSESDSDFSEEEESLRKSPDHKQLRYAPTIGKNAKTMPSLAASTSIFGSDNSDSDENRSKELLSRYSHLRSGVSRRTKALPSSSGKMNYSKTQHVSGTLDSDDDSETGKRPERNSNKLEHSKKPTSRKEASKPIKEKQSPETKQESKVTLKSSAVEESSMHQKKMGASISRENPKLATLDKTSSNKDASASHVHPKLPDYDNLVQLFQKNRS
ncbi:hypothetical protein ACS0TY_021527 [Phlomoides rotata]